MYILKEMSKKIIYTSSVFDLAMGQTTKNTRLKMQVYGPVVNTRDLPQTLPFLRQHYPSVLKTECFNDHCLSFSQEVCATEIGHLFEHIVLDELCALKIKTGAKNAVFNGRTSWNWQRDAQGVFHIVIDAGKKELELLIEAIRTATLLTESLLLGDMKLRMRGQFALNTLEV
jgi:hypothetical protein